jgi:hypothetical protein
MALVTKYGSIYGALPMTAGQVIWVAPSASYTVNGQTYTASDVNRGDRPERAKLTLDAAYALCQANGGDVIALLPGLHTLAASLAASTAGVTVVGVPYFPDQAVNGLASSYPPATITTSAADEAINVTAADHTFVNVRFLPVTQQKAVDFTTAAHRLTFRHCYIDLTTATAHANTRGIHATGATQAPNRVSFQGCVIEESNAGTSNGAAIELGAALNFLVERCLIRKLLRTSSAAWAVAVQMQDNCTGTIRDNDVQAIGGAAGDAITKGFAGVTHTAAAAVLCARNVKSVNVTALFDDWAAADLDLANNYTATVAGGTGGTLITTTT